MRRIVACMLVSLDGIVGEPADWLHMSPDLAATVLARGASADTILLGRVTYEKFASEWPYRPGPIADFMNRTEKLVVSTSLDEACWQNTAIIDGNAAIGEQLTRLRGAAGRDILVLGSATLVHSLLRRALIDDLVLLVHPVLRGPGRRLFGDLTADVPSQRVKCVTFDSGLVSLSYEMNSRTANSPNEQTQRPQMRTPEDRNMRTTDDPTIRELDQRVSDGIDVRLLWHSATNHVSVEVADERTGEFFELDVDPEDALIAFNHPFAYANRSWMDHALAA
jgi:dihydrofolate reductase